jgi:hypothetical protein
LHDSKTLPPPEREQLNESALNLTVPVIGLTVIEIH